MPFPFDEYTWAKFEDLNIAYMIQRLGAIISEANAKLEELDAWKTATEQDLENWKNSTMDLIAEWEREFMADVHQWEHDTEQDLAQWKIDTIAALDVWKAGFITQYEALRVETEHIRDVANAAAHEATQAAASASADAASISASAAQIQTNSDEIANLISANAYPIVKNSDFTHNAGTFNGVTFAWDANNETLTLNGTSSGAFFTNLYVDYNALPGEMEAGKTYFGSVETNNPNLAFSLLFYGAGQTFITQWNLRENGYFTVPENAVGAILRITAPSGVTFSSATIGDIAVYNTPRNSDLAQYISREYAGKNVRIVAGVLRNSGDGWEIINDSGHSPINLDRIGYDADGNIVLYYDFTAKKVLTLIAAPDDDFAKLYTCGASVGLEYAIINIDSIPQTVGGLITYADGVWNAQLSTFNLARSVTGNIVEVTHPPVPSGNTGEWFDISCAPWRGKFSAFVQSVTSQSFQVKMFDLDGAEMATPPAGAGLILSRTTPAARQDARNVVSPTGNIWIFGVMEV